MVIFLEPILFHPIVVYASIKGNISLFFGMKHQWGNMGRMGTDDDDDQIKEAPASIQQTETILKAS